MFFNNYVIYKKTALVKNFFTNTAFIIYLYFKLKFHFLFFSFFASFNYPFIIVSNSSPEIFSLSISTLAILWSFSVFAVNISLPILYALSIIDLISSSILDAVSSLICLVCPISLPKNTCSELVTYDIVPKSVAHTVFCYHISCNFCCTFNVITCSCWYISEVLFLLRFYLLKALLYFLPFLF